MRCRAGTSPIVLFLIVALTVPARTDTVHANPQKEEPAVRLTLGRYIPDNVVFFGAWRPTPERNKLMAPYAAAIKKLMRSGIGNDVLDLITIEMSESKRARVRAVVDRLLELLVIPDWEKLFSREASFAVKLAMPFPEYLLLARVPEGTAGERHEELHKLLEGVAEFAPEHLRVDRSERQGARISRLGLGPVPVAVTAGHRGDFVWISLGEGLSRRSLDLMQAGDGKGAIINSDDFKDSMAGLKKGRDGYGFFNIARYFGFFRNFLQMFSLQNDDPGAQGFFAIASKVLDELSRLGAAGFVDYTKDDRLYRDWRLAFVARDDGPGFMERLVAGQRSVDNYARGVPKDAKSVFLTSGINLAKIYDAVAELIADHMPHGKEHLAEWEGVQKRVGFNVRKDLLGWLEGGCGCVCLPPTSPGGTGSTVIYLRVSDAESARKTVAGVLGAAGRFLESRGQSLELVDLSDLPDADGSFQEIRLSSLASFRPVIGMPRGLLVIASSADGVRRIRDTLEGTAPGLLENPRFTAAGDVPSGLRSLQYHNVENSLSGLADVCGIVGLVASILPENKDTKPLLKAGRALTKLAAFLHDIDLGLDVVSWSSYDAEKHALVGRSMTRLKAAK